MEWFLCSGKIHKGINEDNEEWADMEACLSPGTKVKVVMSRLG